VSEQIPFYPVIKPFFSIVLLLILLYEYCCNPDNLYFMLHRVKINFFPHVFLPKIL